MITISIVSLALNAVTLVLLGFAWHQAAEANRNLETLEARVIRPLRRPRPAPLIDDEIGASDV